MKPARDSTLSFSFANSLDSNAQWQKLFPSWQPVQFFFSVVSHRSFLGQKGLIMRICLLNIPFLHPFRGKNYWLLTRVSPEILIVTNLLHRLSMIVAVVLNRKLNDTNWCGISFQTLARHFSTDNCTTGLGLPLKDTPSSLGNDQNSTQPCLLVSWCYLALVERLLDQLGKSIYFLQSIYGSISSGRGK